MEQQQQMEAAVQEGKMLPERYELEMQKAQEMMQQRISAQRAKAVEKRPLLLLEAQARFYAQISGQFRWVVEFKIHLWNQKNEVFS